MKGNKRHDEQQAIFMRSYHSLKASILAALLLVVIITGLLLTSE